MAEYLSMFIFLLFMFWHCFVQEIVLTFKLCMFYCSVCSAYYSCFRLRSFQMPDWPVASVDVDSVPDAAEAGFNYSPPTILEMYQVTASVLSLMNGKRYHVYYFVIFIVNSILMVISVNAVLYLYAFYFLII